MLDENYGLTDDTARQQALVLVATAEEGGVWTTIAHGHTKTLCRPNDDVGTPC